MQTKAKGERERDVKIQKILPQLVLLLLLATATSGIRCMVLAAAAAAPQMDILLVVHMCSSILRKFFFSQDQCGNLPSPSPPPFFSFQFFF